jgi:hypothetical protein
MAASPFPAIRDHVLLRWAAGIPSAGARLQPRLNRSVFEGVLGQVPDEWLLEPAAAAPDARRAAYVDYLAMRLEAAPSFVEEAESARARLV